MKKTILSLIVALGATIMASAQVLELPSPYKTGGKTILESLWNRESGTEFSEEQLSPEEISNLLFAAIGVNRDNGKLTSPTASNKQEIRVFVFIKEGVGEYLNKENAISVIAEGDYRGLIAGRQDWVKSAPLCLLIVADGNKFGSTNESSMTMMAVDAGIVSQNISLYCAGKGLVTRPRASMDTEGLKKLLSLDENQFPIMNAPIGYKK